MAVYTKVSENEAAEFLRAYDLGELRELVGIKRGVENSNFFLYTTQGRYVLTLYEKRVREEDLPFFLGLMEHLASKAIPCPRPLRTKTGALTHKLSGRTAAIVSFLNGEIPGRTTSVECSETGRILAALHLATADFTLRRENTLSFPGWEKLLASTKSRAGEIMAGLDEILQDELDFLRLRWPMNLPRGVIHADLFPNNVFFDREKLCGVFDFYFACDDFYAYDLAICLNAWCFEAGGAFNITKARALIRGYEQIRPLAPEEKKILPLLSRGAALRFLLTRLYDWLHQTPDALVKPLDPLEYLTRLQFHQMVTDVTAYGLEL